MVDYGSWHVDARDRFSPVRYDKQGSYAGWRCKTLTNLGYFRAIDQNYSVRKNVGIDTSAIFTHFLQATLIQVYSPKVSKIGEYLIS